MAKVLNLDALAPKETRELHLAGQVYKVKEMSVEDFIESSRLAATITDDASFADQMELSVKLIKRGIPTIDEVTLKDLNLEQLAAVSRFVRGEEQPTEVEQGEAGKA